jgi:hypothetical protein
MEDGKHLNFITHDFIEHCERESANNSASEVPINKREDDEDYRRYATGYRLYIA